MDRLKHISFFKKHPKGFTLIEIMVSLVISTVVIGAIYETFINQNKSYVIQEGLVEMQQTMRGVLIILERDIMMAGYDPSDSYKYGIVSFSEPISGPFPPTSAPYGSVLRFTADTNNDGRAPGSGETIQYELYGPESYAGTTVYNLRRTRKGSPVVENIEDFRLAYAYDSDGDGVVEHTANNIIWGYPDSSVSPPVWFNLDTDNDGDIDLSDTEGGISTGTLVNVNTIRFVRVWVLVRADKQDRDYTNTTKYVVGSHHFPAANDHFRRVVLEATLALKNMGIRIGI